VHWARLALLFHATSSLGCEPIVLGDLPQPLDGGAAAPGASSVLVWATDHEGGDSADWGEGGPSLGGEYTWGTGSIEGTEAVSRSGNHALDVSIDNTLAAPSDGARHYRRIEDVEASYAAWFYLNETHAVGEWWAPVIFNARDASLDILSIRPLWDVRLVDDAAGGSTLLFFDHATMAPVSLPQARVPANLWFEIEVTLDYRPPDGTTLALRLNGALVFEAAALGTAVEEHVFWVAGNAGAGLVPSASTLYIDDASVTRREGL
jgi:hypothetical protein